MRQSKTTKYLTVLHLLGCVALGSACTNSSDHESDEQGASEKAEEPRPVSRHPSPALELTSYEGELCPADTLNFSSNPGAFTLTTSTDTSGTEACEIHIQVTVPAGYTFKRPLISSSGYAIREEESAPPTQVAISYTLNERTLTSHHEVSGAWFDSGETESFLLVDTPDIELDACDGSDEPEVHDLVLRIEAAIPDATTFRVVAIDGELDIGVPWFECPAQTR